MKVVFVSLIILGSLILVVELFAWSEGVPAPGIGLAALVLGLYLRSMELKKKRLAKEKAQFENGSGDESVS